MTWYVKELHISLSSKVGTAAKTSVTENSKNKSLLIFSFCDLSVAFDDIFDFEKSIALNQFTSTIHDVYCLSLFIYFIFPQGNYYKRKYITGEEAKDSYN